MPAYEYRCPICQAAITKKRGIAEKEQTPNCANCQVAMIRDYTAPGVTFKGKGWGRDR